MNSHLWMVWFGIQLAQESLHHCSLGHFKMYASAQSSLWCELFIQVINSEAKAIPHFRIVYPAMPRCDKHGDSTRVIWLNTGKNNLYFILQPSSQHSGGCLGWTAMQSLLSNHSKLKTCGSPFGLQLCKHTITVDNDSGLKHTLLYLSALHWFGWLVWGHYSEHCSAPLSRRK